MEGDDNDLKFHEPLENWVSRDPWNVLEETHVNTYESADNSKLTADLLNRAIKLTKIN